MTDEKKEVKKETGKDAKTTPPAAVKTSLLKSPMALYAILAVGSLAVSVAVMTALMGKGDEAPLPESASADTTKVVAKVEGHDESNVMDELDSAAAAALAEFDAMDLSETDEFGSDEESQTDAESHGKNKANRQGAIDTAAARDWLEAEKAALKARQNELDMKERGLSQREADVNNKLTQIDQTAASRYTELAKLYDGMKPDQVARMAGQLDDKTVIAILPRMKPANASKILAALPPARAARISRGMITLSEVTKK